MVFSAYPHTITTAEIKEIETLGYFFRGSGDPALFINTHFANFDLLKVLREIEPILTPTTSRTLYRKVILDDSIAPKIDIGFYSDDYGDTDEGLGLVRSFTVGPNGLTVFHEFFRLPRAVRRKGISRKVLIAFFQQYMNMGVKKILVHAAMEDGGLAWANNYFMATNPKEVTGILNTAASDLNYAQYKLVKTIFDNYYGPNPGGQAFPIFKWAEFSFMEDILKKSEWDGAVDLTNPIEYSNFVKNAIGQI